MSLIQPRLIFECKDSKNNVYQVHAYSFEPTTKVLKSIAVTLPEEKGRAFSGSFAKLHGRFNPKLQVGKAWIFSAKEQEAVKKLVSEIAFGVATPEAKIYQRYSPPKDIQPSVVLSSPIGNVFPIGDTAPFGIGTFQSLNQITEMITSKKQVQPIQSVVDGRVVLLVIGTATECNVEAGKHREEKDFRIQLVINTNDENNNMYATYMSWKAPESIQVNRRHIIDLTVPAETTSSSASSSITSQTNAPVVSQTNTSVVIDIPLTNSASVAESSSPVKSESV